MIDLYTIVLKEEKEPASRVAFHQDLPMAFSRREAEDFFNANYANNGHKVARVSFIGAIEYFVLDPIKRKLYK